MSGSSRGPKHPDLSAALLKAYTDFVAARAEALGKNQMETIETLAITEHGMQ
jgi:hypothetical protein